MVTRWGSRERTVSWGFDLAFAICVAAAVVGALVALVNGAWAQGLVALALVGAAVGFWRRRSQGPASGWTLLGLAGAVIALSLLPALGPSALLLILLSQLVVAFDLGFGKGVAIAVGYGLVFSLTAIVLYEPPWLSVFLENLGVLALLLLIAGFGALMRTSELARSRAAALGRDLTLANEGLRRSVALERDLVLAQERARSARELHDGMGYRLTLVAMSLEYAQKARDRDAESAWAEVGTAAEANRGALSEMRLWARALDPPPADSELSGAAAFEAIADAFRGTGLDVRVTHQGERHALGREAALFATRFIQEGLTNVLRHADAERVDIDVIQSPHQLRLSIGDDGAGAGGTDEGFGRRSLRERAELLNGSVHAGRSSLGGFELVAIVPFTGEA